MSRQQPYISLLRQQINSIIGLSPPFVKYFLHHLRDLIWGKGCRTDLQRIARPGADRAGFPRPWVLQHGFKWLDYPFEGSASAETRDLTLSASRERE